MKNKNKIIKNAIRLVLELKPIISNKPLKPNNIAITRLNNFTKSFIMFMNLFHKNDQCVY